MATTMVLDPTGTDGRTPEGGWTNELQPDDCVHTIITVLTDEVM